jgi:DNA helicase-2/ATP-dependent DNA helicase PcrA
VLNVVDGCMPADMAAGSAAEIEEERRLLYVAMTRAQRHLHLLVPQRFHVTQQTRHGDLHLYAPISRFVTAEVSALCDRVTPAVEREAEGLDIDLPGGAAGAGTALAQRLRDRWG